MYYDYTMVYPSLVFVTDFFLFFFFLILCYYKVINYNIFVTSQLTLQVL